MVQKIEMSHAKPTHSTQMRHNNFSDHFKNTEKFYNFKYDNEFKIINSNK